MRWPWPQDSREDRARRVAHSYRRLALRLAASVHNSRNSVTELDQHWLDHGQSWLVPTQSTINPDDWVTSYEASELFSVPAKSVYDWGRRGHIRKLAAAKNGIVRYSVGDIIQYSHNRGKRRR